MPSRTRSRDPARQAKAPTAFVTNMRLKREPLNGSLTRCENSINHKGTEDRPDSQESLLFISRLQ